VVFDVFSLLLAQSRRLSSSLCIVVFVLDLLILYVLLICGGEFLLLKCFFIVCFDISFRHLSYLNL